MIKSVKPCHVVALPVSEHGVRFAGKGDVINVGDIVYHGPIYSSCFVSVDIVASKDLDMAVIIGSDELNVGIGHNRQPGQAMITGINAALLSECYRVKTVGSCRLQTLIRDLYNHGTNWNSIKTELMSVGYRNVNYSTVVSYVTIGEKLSVRDVIKELIGD